MNERIGILDGSGGGYRAKVNSDNQLSTRSVLVSALHEATLRADAYTWNTVNYDITAADTILTVRNLSEDRLLVINRLYMWTDVNGFFDIHIETIATTFTQTHAAVVVGVNLNTESNQPADADAIADEEAIAAQGSIILTLRSNESATDQFAVDYPTNDAIILGTNGRIAIDASAAAAACEATITGYFIDR